MSLDNIAELLGDEAQDLLEHKCSSIPADQIQVPGSDIIDRVWINTADAGCHGRGDASWLAVSGRESGIDELCFNGHGVQVVFQSFGVGRP